MYDIISEWLFNVGGDRTRTLFKWMGKGEKYAHFQRIESTIKICISYVNRIHIIVVISIRQWACKMLNKTQKVLGYNISLWDYTISLLIVHEEKTQFNGIVLKPKRNE